MRQQNLFETIGMVFTVIFATCLLISFTAEMTGEIKASTMEKVLYGKEIKK